MNWEKLRGKRNIFLAETDRTQLSDFPIDSKNRAKYREYRQYLRDLPKMYNDNTISKAKVKNFQEWSDWKNGGNY